MVKYTGDEMIKVSNGAFLSNAISLCMASFLNIKAWLTSWFNWSPTSDFDLELAERKVLSYLKRAYTGYFVDIGSDCGVNNRIWTIEMKPNDEDLTTGLPLVLIHGFGAGIGFWALNLDFLSSKTRKVYAFDVLGFGRSSRPQLDSSEEVEWQLVQSIERWRDSVGLNSKFILLGHSFGAYLALSYALHFPERAAHVILADPWGIPSQLTAQQSRVTAQYTLPMWVKVVNATFLQAFNPLAALRAAGPWGPTLVNKLRPDLRRKYECLTGAEDGDLMLNYVYHCNAQPNPSGEGAFKSLALPLGWARFPMIQRVGDLDPDIDLTFIYGSRSWIDRQPAFQIKYLLRDRSVDVHVVQGAGHHVYADKYENFNQLVDEICEGVDERVQAMELEMDSLNISPSDSLYEQD